MRLFHRSRHAPLIATLVAIGALLVAGLVVAALDDEAAEARPRRAALTALGSCDGLRAYLARHREALGVTRVDGLEAGTVADGFAAAPAEGSAAPSGTATNVQEAGVDEPDIVKVSGSTIFTVDGTRLRAVDTAAGLPALRDSLELPHGPGGAPVGEYQLLVAGDRLLAIGSSYGYAMPVEGEGVVAPDVAYGEPRTILAEVDISDPAAISILRTMTVEGSYLSARQAGSSVRLVSSAYPSPAGAGDEHVSLPRISVRDRSTGERRRGPLVDCAEASRPSRFAGTSMLSVLTIDLDRGLPAIDVDTVLTDGGIVYASPTSLYVATERWTDPGAEPTASQVSTQIHRFDITDPEATEYVASGRVPGYMLSQWSMSEHDGVLRVASTSSPPFAVGGDMQLESESFVTALAQDGDRLRAVGRVGGLGRGEQIYAVRFIGETGYVVTFRQVDPLYVLDLADPTDPRVVGELKIPGYSAYLHPVGPGLLLGIGRDADAGGTTTGVQASLFDVSDPASPVRLDRESFGGGSSSEVEYDHHAFSWFATDALAIVPIDSYTAAGELHTAVGMRVTPGGADPLGRVAKLIGGGSLRAEIRRTLELDGTIYAVAATGIDAYEPSTLAPVGSLDY